MNYKKLYHNLITFRKSYPLEKSEEIYTELHHILPECIGGGCSKENMVRLTGREHFIAHRLLSKIHSDCPGLQFAVWGMMNTREGAKVPSSKEYDRLKSEASKFLSVRNKYSYEKNPELRLSHSRKMKRKYQEDPELRIKNSNAQKERFSDLNKRKEMSAALKEHFLKNPDAKVALSEARKRFYRDNPGAAKAQSEYMKEFVKLNQPRPWMNNNAKRTKEIWALAGLFYEQNISSEKFSELYNESKNINIFHRMKTMIRKEGWVPHLDIIWLKEFGHFRF